LRNRVEKKTRYEELWQAHKASSSGHTLCPLAISGHILDPSVDIEALNLCPVGKIIARAAQKYGFVVWDKAGGITLRADNTKSFTQRGEKNPYPELFGGKPEWSLLQGFPWEKLQFLPLNYGKDGNR